MQTATRKKNVLDTALAVLRGIAQDDQWITVHPNGPDATGRPALIDESGTIKAGMGGKFNGRSIDDVPRGKNPHPVKEEKYQARQKRMAEKQGVNGNAGQSWADDPATKERAQRLVGHYAAHFSPAQQGVLARKAEEFANGNDINFGHKNDSIHDMVLEKLVLDKGGYVSNAEMPGLIQEARRVADDLQQKHDAAKSNTSAPPAPQQPSQQAGGGGNATSSGGRYSTLRPQELANLMQTGTQGAKTKAEAYAIAKQNADVIFADAPAIRAELAQKKQAWEQASQSYANKEMDALTYEKYLTDYNDFEKKHKGYLEGEEQFRRGYEKVKGLVEGQNIQLPQTPPVLGSNAPKSNTYSGTLPTGQSKLRKSYKIEKETDKAYGVKVNGAMQWIPKSRSTAHEGEIVGMEGWLWQKTGMDSALAADSLFLALDRNSVRTKDENGYLHVKSSHISKATINPYYGKEIPGWREEGLEPDKIYYGLRDPEELEKSVPTWAGLPLHIEHHIDSAEDPQKLTRVGTVGTEIIWNDPYLDAPLTIWDQHAIDGIEDDSFRELSCAYRYEPDFTPGTWNGKHYDFVMRHIRGNHVALVEEGRAGSDVLVADAKPDAMRKTDVLDIALDVLRLYTESLKDKEGQVPRPANSNSLKQEGLMSRFRKWFGAQDSNEPAPENEKVDLVKAILDLHRKDPKTGELREVQEDADKVAELKVLVEGMRDKLPPEELERLIAAIGALAEAEEVGDEDPLQKKEEEVENVHADAMRKAGCDAEDPDEARAFAGGVAYGEELERNPEERAKLDREHESEGMQKAMDRCGVDAENPAETRAFAEGVKYGEEAERAKAEAKDADPEKEPEQKDENPAEVGKDEDKDAMIKKILAAVPDLTEEQKKKIQDTLSDLAYEPATGDEDLEKKVEGAADRALRKRRFLGAVDAARIRAQAAKDAMDRMRQISEACRVVRPLVGEMDALGFDSANDVYGYTLEQLGKDPLKYDRKAWRGMVAMLLDSQSAMARDSKPAINSKPIPDSGPFRYLKNITISG